MSKKKDPAWLKRAIEVFPYLEQHRGLVDGLEGQEFPLDGTKCPAFAWWLRWLIQEAAGLSVNAFSEALSLNQSGVRNNVLGRAEPNAAKVLAIQAGAWRLAGVQATLDDLWALVFPEAQIPPWRGQEYEGLRLRKNGLMELSILLQRNLAMKQMLFSDLIERSGISADLLSILVLNEANRANEITPAELALVVKAFGGGLKNADGKRLALSDILLLLFERS